jgi:hypothetical protein
MLRRHQQQHATPTAAHATYATATTHEDTCEIQNIYFNQAHLPPAVATLPSHQQQHATPTAAHVCSPQAEEAAATPAALQHTPDSAAPLLLQHTVQAEATGNRLQGWGRREWGRLPRRG